MNLSRQQTATLGIGLITFGVIVWLNLWWLVVPGLLISGGALAYAQRRSVNRIAEAVQLGLWGVGLGIFAIPFMPFIAGFFLLGGTSLLIRGREDKADTFVQRMLGRVRRRSSSPSVSVQQVPITQQPTVVTPTTQQDVHEPSTGETTRL
ncbi:MAG: hypothetical protein GFH27_549289n225 [Chloroflexi bacterium AL-W]|nr:hypothetical protein [Chloroflexi bacterium AL-N1]NOK66958.1 hypothetical protein [Chloroflexi bacterium AL-N10]NOK74750.1 hypothetical protein [Chloroflexi bacterium AL-N5]NOK81560.1 hypothetical protein [Chloroflexi bacterium AL-W]NOK89030.1 hypothetical protein [Chloroflexi bacterium AL-N15]